MSCPETNTDPHRLRHPWLNISKAMTEAGERAGRRIAEEIERLTIESILRPWTEEEDNDKGVANCPPDTKVL